MSDVKLLPHFGELLIMNRINITHLFLQETGRYNPMVSRPYHAVGTNEALDNLASRVADVSRTNPHATVSGGLIAGLSNGLIAPSANWDHELSIPNSWGEQRLRFIMEVEIDTGLRAENFIFQGYSEFKGVSLSGLTDPDMLFYINSFVRINRAQDYSGLSAAGFRDTIAESVQVINGAFFSSNASPVYGLRPSDLFEGVQSAHLTEALRGANEGSVVDTRMNHAMDSLRSRRNNMIPSNFLGRVIDNYRTATSLADFGNGTSDVYDRAIQTSYESSPAENPFIRAISDRRGRPNTTYFTLNDLLYIDPSCQARIDYAPVSEAYCLASPGDTDGWKAGNLETQKATILANSVTGLMVENMLASVTFSSTNMTFGAVLDTRILGHVGIANVEMAGYLGNFVRRFEMEIMPDITGGNSFPISMVVSADMYGDTRIELSVDGGPMIPYVAPTFCDALTTPVITTDVNEYHGLVTGVETIVNYCNAATYTDSLRANVNLSI